MGSAPEMYVDSRELVGGPMRDNEGTPFRTQPVHFGSNELTLLKNRAQCLVCWDIIESTTRHEFRTCKCGAISVDGGVAYSRRVGQLENVNDLNIYGPKYKSNSEGRRLFSQIADRDVAKDDDIVPPFLDEDEYVEE